MLYFNLVSCVLIAETKFMIFFLYYVQVLFSQKLKKHTWNIYVTDKLKYALSYKWHAEKYIVQINIELKLDYISRHLIIDFGKVNVWLICVLIQ